MKEVYKRLFISNENFCKEGNEELFVVHACKSPCHQRAVQYSKSLPNTHPNYLVKEDEFNLYLNIIDPPRPLFMPPLFTNFLVFMNKHWMQEKNILIHCNQGESRAPSLALLFMTKCLSALNNDSYEAAKNEFKLVYPNYNPGKGIQIYFSENWNKLGDF